MPARTTGRIIIPTKPAELLTLAQKIYDKHLADGASSPLNAMSDFSWSVEGPKVAPCGKLYNCSATAAGKSFLAT